VVPVQLIDRFGQDFRGDRSRRPPALLARAEELIEGLVPSLARNSHGCGVIISRLVWLRPDIGELRLRTADFIVRLFAGGNPAEMPFEQPTRFEMAINSKVAHSIGMTIPSSLYVRADEVIEWSW
jgi:hypothetical protein